MTKAEILKIIKNLASNQGFYTGLYHFLSEDSEESNEYLTFLESKQFKDPVDLVLYFES